MGNRPFKPLITPREVNRSDLPSELRGFYEQHEGLGLDFIPEIDVCLSCLGEISRKSGREMSILNDADLEKWGDFDGFLIGASLYGDEIYLVNWAPCCERGTILVLGWGVAGPGGHGPDVFESSLVLALNFKDWIIRLERLNWVEFGIFPGEIWDLPESQQVGLLAYYKSLNPGIDWTSSPES